MKDLTIIILAVCVIIVWVIFTPIAAIAALNILFGLGIVYTFWTWLSALFLLLMIFPISIKTRALQ